MSLYWIRATFDIYRGVNFMWIAENWNDFEVLDWDKVNGDVTFD